MATESGSGPCDEARVSEPTAVCLVGCSDSSLEFVDFARSGAGTTSGAGTASDAAFCVSGARGRADFCAIKVFCCSRMLLLKRSVSRNSSGTCSGTMGLTMRTRRSAVAWLLSSSRGGRRLAVSVGCSWTMGG